MNRIVLNFGDYILNEKRKEAELFLSNRINESNEFGKLISPIEFIKTRTYDKIDYFFKDKKYKEDIKKLDLNSVIRDIVDWYESGGGEPGLTWKSTQEALLIQESAGSEILKYSARVKGLLSKVRNPKIKENISVLHKAIKIKMKDVSAQSFSEFLTKNVDDILKKTSPQNVPTSMDPWGPIIPRTEENVKNVYDIIDWNDKELYNKVVDVLPLDPHKKSTLTDKRVGNILKELFEIVVKKKPEDITNSVQSYRLLLGYGEMVKPIHSIFDLRQSTFEIIDWEEVIESGIRPYITDIGGQKRFFLGDNEVYIDSKGYMFFQKIVDGQNTYKNIEGKFIYNIDDYKKSFVDLFQKYVKPQDYNETFVKKYGVPSFDADAVVKSRTSKSFKDMGRVKVIKGADEPIEEIELNTILDQQVGPAVVQSEEQLKSVDKKDYSLVKKYLKGAAGVSAIGTIFWGLWSRDWWNEFGSQTDYFPSKFPKEFIKETNRRIQSLSSYKDLNTIFFGLGEKYEIPTDVLPKISYYIAQCMQTYYGKIIPTYMNALVVEEATK